MTTYTNGKTSTTERNSGRKPKFIERDRRTLKRIERDRRTLKRTERDRRTLKRTERDRRTLKRTERDRRTLKRTVSKSHTTAAAKVKTELNIHLADPVSTKKSSTRASQIQHPRYSCNC